MKITIGKTLVAGATALAVAGAVSTFAKPAHQQQVNRPATVTIQTVELVQGQKQVRPKVKRYRGSEGIPLAGVAGQLTCERTGYPQKVKYHPRVFQFQTDHSGADTVALPGLSRGHYACSVMLSSSPEGYRRKAEKGSSSSFTLSNGASHVITYRFTKVRKRDSGHKVKRNPTPTPAGQKSKVRPDFSREY